MTALVFRHLKLYFRNKSNVFFSILGALIAFVLYLVFLQKKLRNKLEADSGFPAFAGPMGHGWCVSGNRNHNCLDRCG